MAASAVEAKDTVDDSAETKVVGKRATFEEDDITEI